MDPMQALEEMDALCQQVPLTRQQHAHVIKCRTTVVAALNDLKARKDAEGLKLVEDGAKGEAKDASA